MKTERYPLCVIPAVPHEKGIRFLHPKQPQDISNFVDVIWSILAQCNGYNSVQYITQLAHKQHSEVEFQTILAIIKDLHELGVIMDSREVFRHFHKYTINPASYSHPMSFDDIRRYTDSPRMQLKTGDIVGLTSGNSTTSKLLSKRVSCRNFAGDTLTLEQISMLCTHAYSLSNGTAPSAGGLYPLKIYIVLTRDHADISAGYYEYDPEGHTLIRYSDEDIELLQYAFDSETLLHGAPLILVIAGDLLRQTGKYSNRGYRYTILEAGHVAQNVHIIATELGLSTLEYGGFLDVVLAKELAMEDGREFPLITVAVGKSTDSPTFDAMYLFEDLERALVGRGKPVNYVRLASGGQPEKGEAFFAATAHYAPATGQNARRGSRERFSYGTATSSFLAQVTALAEAYERFASGEVRVDVTAKANKLRVPWLDPRRVVPFTKDQLAQQKFLQPFDEEVTWQWVYGTSLRNNETVLVPADLVFYPLETATFGRKLCYEANSSGVAAFTSQDEAVRRGLLELVERDAIMRNWFKRKPPSRIAHNQLPHHWRKRATYWEAQGRNVHVLDLSVHGVAVVNVTIVSETDYPCFVDGAAASERSFNEAVGKAFHEAELSLMSSLKTKPSRRIKPEKVFSPLDHSKLYAFPDYIANLRWLWMGPETTQPKPTATLETLIERLAPIVIKLSDEPLHVVRIISEALIPISFGCGNEHYSHGTINDVVDISCLRLPHYFA